jgi:hypothetical protein
MEKLEEGLLPNAYFVLVVADYIKEHLNEIKNAISMIKEKRCASPLCIEIFQVR